MDDQAKTKNSDSDLRSRIPWWVWLLLILFPIVFTSWWAAIISIALFAVFLILVLSVYR